MTATGTPWDSPQSRALVAYAPQSTASDPFPALPVVPLLPWFEEAWAPPRPLLRPPHRSATRIDALGGSSSSTLGLPWDSQSSLARFASAPQLENVDVLLALVVPPATPSGWGPWLYSEPSVSRYTVVTLDQPEDLPALAAPAVATSHAWNVTRTPVSSWRTRRPPSVSDQPEDLAALRPALAGSGSASIGLQALGSGSEVIVGTGAAAMALSALGSSAGGISGAGAPSVETAASGAGTETLVGSGAAAAAAQALGTSSGGIIGAGAAAVANPGAVGTSGAFGIGGSGAASPVVVASATGDNTTYDGAYIAPTTRALRVARVPKD